MASLVFLSGSLAGREIPLPEGSTRVGRSHDNELVLADPSISRRHCLLLKHGPEVIVRVLTRRANTWVNQLVVTGQRVVAHGQVIRWGNVEARLIRDQHDRPAASTTITVTHELMRGTEPQAGEKAALRAAWPARPTDAASNTATATLAPPLDEANEGNPPPINRAPAGQARATPGRRWWAVALTTALTLLLLILLMRRVLTP